MSKKPVSTIDSKLKARMDKVTGKRARVVLDIIEKNGFATTLDIKNAGYDHPPRAAGDVKDAGIPLVMKMKTIKGRRVGHYYLGNPADITEHKLDGRKVLSKTLKNKLYSDDENCAVCRTDYEKRYLQIDHRVPYRIATVEADESDTGSYMLLCGTCQRKKSWSCENCPNWATKNEDVCKGCYWVSPEGYTHIATKQIRRVEMNFEGANLEKYEALDAEAKLLGIDIAELILKKL